MCVLHAMAASPSSGRLFVVATARDDQDGVVDGFADRSALYVFDLVAGEVGLYYCYYPDRPLQPMLTFFTCLG